MTLPEGFPELSMARLLEVYAKLPSVPRIPQLLVVQQRLNHQASMQVEIMARSVGMSVIRSPYLPEYATKIPVRRQYKTRAGFKHARNYWRWRARRDKRVAASIAYAVYGTAKNLEIETMKRYFTDSPLTGGNCR